VANELVFPNLFPAREDFTLVDDATSVFVSSFGQGLTQRVSRAAPRWRLQISFEKLSGSQRNLLISFLSAVRGKSKSFYYYPKHATFRGSFPASELTPNSEFDTTTGWSASSGEISLYADVNRLRITRSAVTANAYATTAQLTGLTNNGAYLIRGTQIKGKGNAYWNLRFGSTAGSSNYFETGPLQYSGHGQASGVISGTTGYFSIYDYITGRVAGDYQIYSGISLSRCARVNGSSQTGSALNVKSLPASTNGLLLPGDIVSVWTNQWELKRITQSLNSDGSGNGYMQFESELRATPANDAPIAIHAPHMKVILATDPKMTTQPGMYSDFDFELIEIVE